jgi:hypothetical protein
MVVLLAAVPAWGATQQYATTFDCAESPISECGAWSHVGLGWTTVVTEGGFAHGTETGLGGYDDSYAHLSGFSPSQAAGATYHRPASLDGSCSHEVEILLRWADSDHNARGYECNVSFDGGYTQIVRWNGPKGSRRAPACRPASATRWRST